MNSYSPTKVSREIGNVEATSGFTQSSKDVSYTTKQKANARQQTKMNQSNRGRSLTRQTAVKGHSKVSPDDKSQMTITSNCKIEENPSTKLNRQNNTVKGSPTKYLLKKQDMPHVSHQTSSNPKTPSHEETKKQPYSKNTDLKHNQYHSTNNSNNATLGASREQTPKAPTSSKQSQQDAREEQGLNMGKQKSNSRITIGKHIS